MRRRAPLLYHVISVAFLVLGLWGIAALRSVSALPQESLAGGARYPLTIDGATAASAEEARILVQRLAPGSEALLHDAAGPRRVLLRRAYNLPYVLISLICGLALWWVPASVFASRMDRGPMRDFYWGLHLYGIAVMTGGVHFPLGGTWPGATLSLLRLLGLAVVPFLFLHMTLSFPSRSSVLDRNRWIEPALTLIPVVTFSWNAATILGYFSAPGPGAWAHFDRAQLSQGVALIGGNALGCAVLLTRAGRAQLARERRQLMWLLWGVTLGVTPFALLYVLPQILGGAPLIPLWLARLATLTLPASMGIAIARERFLDIDIIIRRSLIYGVLAALMVLLYYVLAVLIGRQVEHHFPQFAPYAPVLATAVSLALFLPTRRAIGILVDRTVFQIRYGYDQALEEFRAELPAASTQQEIADRTCAFLGRQLRVKRAAVVARVDSESRVAALRADEIGTIRDLARDPAVAHGGRVVAPHLTMLPDVESARFPVALLQSGYLYVEPLAVGDRALGYLMLGEKITERRYLEQDVDLIGSVARDATRALDRLHLVQKAAEEARARERLGEIDRLKTEFLSRVAHDLRTPLASVSWSVQNLLDGIAGPLGEVQVDYLRSVRASTAQLSRLVNNLLEISRLEAGKGPAVAEPVDWTAIVGEAISSLTPLGRAKGVRIESCVAPGLGPVGSHRDKLNEVVVNLLENAIRYAPPGSAVEVTLERAAAGRQRLRVRDHGPGVPAGEREAIFERFHQGAPSPYSDQRGFGLGLYVVRSYLAQVSGSVRVDDAPGEGASFVCEVPEWSRKAA